MCTNRDVMGEEYYQLIAEKNEEGVKKYLDPNVEFTSPLATLKGKDAVAGATANFMKAFKTLKIRAKFGSADQAMIIYDVDIPGVSSHLPGASLLTFRDQLIVRIELFHDASRFSKEF